MTPKLLKPFEKTTTITVDVSDIYLSRGECVQVHAGDFLVEVGIDDSGEVIVCANNLDEIKLFKEVYGE